MGRYITTTGTAAAVLRDVNTNFNASPNDRILCDSTGGSFTITLPPNATVLDNDTLQIIDATGTFGTNNVTIARNGSLILGAADDVVLDVNGAVITLLYTGSTYGWIFTGT
jgi:hypothetical protein